MTSTKKDLYNLAEGWLELESDPGLFTLLMEDMGVQGVQVEEIYDLQREPLVEKKPCYGAIFLFRWIEDRRSRRKIVEEEHLYLKDEEKVNQIFFAQQMIPNSCATHALVSILLNCPTVDLGITLSTLRNHVKGMNPENKGLAIGNCPELAQAHNSHAIPRARRRFEKSNIPSTGSRYTGEAFHFVSYVPINDRLIELDGLRKYPIDHGPIPDPDNWTEKLREVITARLGIASGDIRFALMALVPDSRLTFQRRLNMLNTNRQIVITALRQLLTICAEKKKKRKATEESKIKKEVLVVEEEDDCVVINDDEEEEGTTPEVDQLEKDVMKAINEDQDLIKDAASLMQNQEDTLVVLPSTLKVPDKISNKPLVRLSRGSSLDSQPRSPFQSNPLLTAHDYSKSPLMEGCKDIEEVMEEEEAREEYTEDPTAEPRKDERSTTEPRDSSIKPELSTSTQDVAEPSSDKANHSEKSDPKLNSEDGTNHTTTEPSEESRDVDRQFFSLSLTEKRPEFDPQEAKLKEPHTFTPKDLLTLLRRIETEIYMTEGKLKDELETHKKYIVDDCRRVHNYDEFITTFISMLAEQNMLAELVEHGMGTYRRTVPASLPSTSADNSNKQNNKKVTGKLVGKAGGAGRKKKKKYEDSDSEWSDEARETQAPAKPGIKVLYNDSTLPKGWKRKVKKQPGLIKYDVLIFNPEGKQFKTKAELKNHLEKEESELNAEDFDFSVCGVKRTNIKYNTKRKK